MRALLALDLRTHPERVVAEAVPWAALWGARLDLVWVDDTPTGAAFVSDPSVAALVTREADKLHALHAERLQALLGRLPEDLRGEAHLLAGDPCEAVVDLAASYDALLVTTHGRQGIAHFWLGSVAERIVRYARVPVLVLRLPSS